MKLCLIVYYSRTGTTATVAEALAQACDAELEAIRETHAREGSAGYLRSAWESIRGRPAAIAPSQHDPAHYPFVVLGTPVWAGSMSSPMRAYILRHRGQLRRVGMFCTMGGSGGEKVLNAMADLSAKAPLARLCLREADVRTERYHRALDDFADALIRVDQRPDVTTGAP